MNESSDVVPQEWIGQKSAFPCVQSVLDFFREAVQTHPENVAVEEEGRRATYRELDECSNHVANALRRHGLRHEEAVAVFLPASFEFLVAIIGLLKAGGAYVPVATDAPIKRLEFLLSDCHCRLAISNAGGRDHFAMWSGKLLEIETIIQPAGVERDSNPAMGANPGDRAYVIYTSGSTGRPKGVEIEHHSLTNFVCCYRQRLNLTAQDRVSMLSYVSFDASIMDIWPALCVGATVVVPPGDLLLKPDGLIAWLAEKKITVSFVSTGLVEIILTRPWPERMQLRFLLTGGDRLRVRPAVGLPFTLINGYGPTENTVFSTWCVVLPEDGVKQAPPIGQPLMNTSTYVLGEQRQWVPVGVAGEIYVGGEQVARGYLNQSGLTAEKFLPDPFAVKRGARMYRTGDWARWLPDGNLDFLGRKDGQIQIRGVRVELGEVESALFAHDEVKQVCCVPWLDDGMPAAIIAHVVPRNDIADLAERLLSHLQPLLPGHMIPQKFELHEQLPLTAQGKTDRAALMARQSDRIRSTVVDLGGDGLEKSLAGLWHSLLPAAEGAPAGASFASLGGDSLLAIKLLLGVEEITNQRLEVSTFMSNPTFAGLCAAVKTRMEQTGFEPVLAVRRHGSRPPLFFLHLLNGDIDAYFELARALGNDQPVFGIRSPALENLSKLPRSMAEAAAEAIRLIRRVQPRGVPALLGFSWAGQLAFEVARQFYANEKIDCYTAVIGTTAPDLPMGVADRVCHLIRHFPAWFWHLLANQERRSQRLRRWRGMILGIKLIMADTRLPVEEWMMTQPWAASPVSRHMLGLLSNYHPAADARFRVNVFLERNEYPIRAHPLYPGPHNFLPDGGWKRRLGKAQRIHWLACNHNTILKQPVVSDLARLIRETMDEHFA